MKVNGYEYEIKEISLEEMDKLIASGDYDRDYEPLGLFITQDDDAWIVADNLTGNCWVEEFKSKEDAINWLYGEEEDMALAAYDNDEEYEKYSSRSKKSMDRLLLKAENYLAEKKIDWDEAYVDFKLGNSGLTEEEIKLWQRDIEVMAHFMATLYELAEEV